MLYIRCQDNVIRLYRSAQKFLGVKDNDLFISTMIRDFENNRFVCQKLTVNTTGTRSYKIKCNEVNAKKLKYIKIDLDLPNECSVLLTILSCYLTMNGIVIEKKRNII